MVYGEPSPNVGGRVVEIHSSIGYFGCMTASQARSLDFRSIAPGQCILLRGDPSPPSVGRNSRLWLDAGADDSADGGTLTVSGPNLPGVPLDGDDDYYYRLFSARLEDGTSVAGNPSHRLAPRTHTLRGAGGSTVGPFEAGLQMPEFLKWTNRGTIQEVRRDRALH